MLCEMRRAVEMPLLPGKGPRQRRVVPLADESASSTLAKTKRTGHSTQSHLLPGASVVVCVLVYICTGIYCALSAPKATSKFGDHIVPDTARCARVTRHADYASVDLAIGVPSQVLRLLLRLDRPADLVNSTFVRIHSSAIVESTAVATLTPTTGDALISQRGRSLRNRWLCSSRTQTRTTSF